MAALLRHTITRSLPLRPALLQRTFAPALRALAPFPAFATPSFTTPAMRFGVARAFGASSGRFMPHGVTDKDLIHKLEEEVTYEGISQANGTPEFIKNFLETHSFKIEDRPGHDEVILTRNFGNEKIKVLFSISDINNGNELDEAFESDAVAEEDDVAEAETPDEEETSFPVRCSVTIEKNHRGALTIDTIAQDGTFMIESILFYRDARLAGDTSAEADWQRRGLYIGPQFGELDEGVQVLFEQYLEERGIDTALAQFIPDYVEHKEQREYVGWLENVKDFVGA